MQKSQKKKIILWVFLMLFWLSSIGVAIWSSIWWFKEDEVGVGVLLNLPGIFFILYFDLIILKVLKNHRFIILFALPTFIASFGGTFISIMMIGLSGLYEWSEITEELIALGLSLITIILSGIVMSTYKKEKLEKSLSINQKSI